MMKQISYLTLLTVSLLGTGLSSCVSVKEYQKSRINDADMELSARKSEKFEQNFYLYREGAAGANGGKSGGGCGCN
jgi:hypothetical protein